MVPKVRVLLHAMPRMLRDILVSALERDSGFDVLGDEPLHFDALHSAVVSSGPDAVITYQSQICEMPEFLRLVEDIPGLKLFEIAEGGRQLHLVELQPVCRSFGQLAPDEIAACIRTAVTPPMAPPPTLNGGSC